MIILLRTAKFATASPLSRELELWYGRALSFFLHLFAVLAVTLVCNQQVHSRKTDKNVYEFLCRWDTSYKRRDQVEIQEANETPVQRSHDNEQKGDHVETLHILPFSVNIRTVID